MSGNKTIEIYETFMIFIYEAIAILLLTLGILYKYNIIHYAEFKNDNILYIFSTFRE